MIFEQLVVCDVTFQVTWSVFLWGFFCHLQMFNWWLGTERHLFCRLVAPASEHPAADALFFAGGAALWVQQIKFKVRLYRNVALNVFAVRVPRWKRGSDWNFTKAKRCVLINYLATRGHLWRHQILLFWTLGDSFTKTAPGITIKDSNFLWQLTGYHHNNSWVELLAKYQQQLIDMKSTNARWLLTPSNAQKTISGHILNELKRRSRMKCVKFYKSQLHKWDNQSHWDMALWRSICVLLSWNFRPYLILMAT